MPMAMRCVLIDDSTQFLTAAALLLEAQGFEIVGRATSGEEAVELVTALRPDLALVDIELGDEDGIELTNDLARRARETRFVLISAHERDDLRDVLDGSRAAGFLPKSSLGADAILALLGR
jgi:two-component system, NarL family, nitrate/nitrite response regulator NarL